MADDYPSIEEASIPLLALSVLTFTLAYIVVEILKALHFERKDYQKRFFDQLLELIDAVDYSGKEKDIFPSAKIPALQQNPMSKPKKIEELSLIRLTNSILDNIDQAWDYSVNKTANTINIGLMRPVKWGRSHVRTAGSKIYQTANSKVQENIVAPLSWGKTQTRNISFDLYSKTITVIKFGLAPTLHLGLEKAQSIVSPIRERLSFLTERSKTIKK